MKTKHDERIWKIVSNFIANDPEPYTTDELFNFCDQCNTEHEDDDDWTPFDLYDRGDDIVDLSHQRGDEGFIAALPYDEKGE